jgi:hypothetical protein
MVGRRTFILGMGAAAALPTRLTAQEALSIPFQLRVPRIVSKARSEGGLTALR